MNHCSITPPHSTLITGGVRSGKSSYALSLAANARNPYFIATGWATDVEMADRIRRHQADRGEHWQLIETLTDLPGAIKQAEKCGADFILIDCLTLWTSNIFLEGEEKLPEMTRNLANAVRQCSIPMALVTNEVGSGIVPDNKLARRYRDAAGFVNRSIADAADALVMVICGQPLRIK